MQSRDPSNLKGIDISSNQGVVDFVKIKDSGIQIVYIKATEGISYLNPLLGDSYNKAVAAGLKIGFYHFFRAKDNDTENAKQQAAYFYNAIKNYHCDCRLTLDIETTEGIQSKDVLSQLAKTFLDELKALSNKDVVLYTYTNFAQTNLTNILAGYPLWIAHYGVNTPGDNPIWNSWIGFQYDNKGTISGITTVVDLNEFTTEIYLTLAVNEPVAEIAPKPQPAPTPAPAPKPAPVPKPAPAPVATIRVGSKVKMTGKKYATGQNIPLWAKLRTYDVLQIEPGKILVGIGKTVTGWILSSEIKIIKI